MAVKVADIVLLAPTAMLPRLAVVGDTASVPVAPLVPESGMWLRSSSKRSRQL